MISGTFYTLGETAQVLGKSRLTIRRWLQAGKVSGQRIGHVLLIEAKEVERLKEELGV